LFLKILYVALGGAAGSLARWGLGAGIDRFVGSTFSWGTLAVNMLGCFVFGVLAGLAESRMPLGEEYRLLLFVGFLGAFTTFSTYAFHTGVFLHEKEWWHAALNLSLHNFFGVLLLLLGLYLTRPA